MASFGKLFSCGEAYAAFRPSYPAALYETILRFGDWTTENPPSLAVDLGCGTGQATVALSKYCQRVIGVDPSPDQVKGAIKADRVEYLVGSSEDLSFAREDSVDLVVAAQAAHWFDLPAVYKECLRVMRRANSVLAFWGYAWPHVRDNSQATALAKEFHGVTLKDYWEKERKLVDAGYVHLDFPLRRKEKHDFEIIKEMSLAHFLGYLGTCSALKTYRTRNKDLPDPLIHVAERLSEIFQTKDFESTTLTVVYPVFLYLGTDKE